ncbi:hypothetical protein RFI_21419 [Reticulomyxa filosa]|uniref:Uncharacterized protein n=1 Tax=Reticulomyxa filosa TaxID=46433 RepID=X6MQ33_RETFI|nr:hypothetical protein RFI_21419 [Reticulomyxa filosa]|eukprot:ETO15939.1 hypothetical protein RFI_21419 [Reticulomyxa filosa]
MIKEWYANFANYWKNQKKVACMKQRVDFHHDILFYLIPPDEDVVPEKAMRDVFDIQPPSGVMWAIIFVQNLKDEDRKESLQVNGRVVTSSASNSAIIQPDDFKIKDPRLRRTLEREKEKEGDKNKQTVEKLTGLAPTEAVETSVTPHQERLCLYYFAKT